jgi:hypothetical protein
MERIKKFELKSITRSDNTVVQLHLVVDMRTGKSHIMASKTEAVKCETYELERLEQEIEMVLDKKMEISELKLK